MADPSGRRLAVLLAEEVTGRDYGPPGRLDFETEREPGDVTGTPGGEHAGTVVRAADAAPVATLVVYPDRTEVCVERGWDAAAAVAREAGLPIDADDRVLRVTDGAAVKDTLDALAAAAE